MTAVAPICARHINDATTATAAKTRPSIAAKSASATIVQEPMKSPSDVAVQCNSSVKKIVPASHPHQNAAFQDAFDHSQNNGASPMNAATPRFSFGNASASSTGHAIDNKADMKAKDTVSSRATADALRIGRRTFSLVRSRGSVNIGGMRVWKAIFASSAIVSASCAALALGLASCGRGPVLIQAPAGGGTITFRMFVLGQIAPSQGDYIIAVNADIDPNTDVNTNELPGEPTAQEAQLGTYTHWDQEFIYGIDSATQPNGFLFQYKAINTGGGGSTVQFVPVILTVNEYTFVPNGSDGTSSNNAISVTVPIARLSIRGNPAGPNPPTITSPGAVQLYVNYITVDTARVPQDQLGCCGVTTAGYTLIVDLTRPGTYSSSLLATPPGKPGPTNQNLWITGGTITVNP